MFESPRGTPTIITTRLEGCADITERRRFLGNLEEEKERKRRGDAGENGDAGGGENVAEEDARGEEAERVETQKEEGDTG
ncbi:hypothetical protein NDU88_004659 [Pleurodeles waltl]|uniref:Uncharacterized protein n=1 Tax=Pleurodeles waltl TaxID=8319 RepID=A0AAV7MAJ6_PLEWA|nr:hypothetical protein NDU88_004659 [Pleurodeles waltl]